VQPIYDHAVPNFVLGRVVLVGDAATLCRPHTASGAVKAMLEAVTFEAAGSANDTWPEVLAAFDTECCPAGKEVVEISRLLGRGLVEHPPDWANMSSAQAQQFITSLIAGRTLYMQPSAPFEGR
jgi:2-polyprenyl-6-methoxyphenol hydroxylase-like FAD-dependent oxidoreductase